MERTVELHALLREILLLRHDAVYVVVAYLQTVECDTYRHAPSVHLSAFRKCSRRRLWLS